MSVYAVLPISRGAGMFSKSKIKIKILVADYTDLTS